MIKIEKDFDQLPRTYHTRGKNAIYKTVKKHVQNRKYEKTSRYSNDSIKNKLEELYHNKCGFCESKIKHVASLQVEHFRPKSEVKESSSHPGYYWLALEWSNLLLACPACNGGGAKGIHFPIAGTRVLNESPIATKPNGEEYWDRSRSKADQSPLKDEKALLIHPEIDNPSEHLTFSLTHFCELEGITPKGETTKDVIKLNRDELVKTRQEWINKWIDNMNAIFLLLLRKIDDSDFIDELEELVFKQFNKLKAMDDVKKEYTFWHQQLILNFETLLLPQFTPKLQDLIKFAWQKHQGITV
ncbi:hypothetical protein FUAX_54430 (plasmid) [Fulvitalea axinellae]|uniref:HNH nuclease domain-containing protein n=1 Tax=Fulvitalea axinellae TaxID=1182444 RepID=A0AAU9CLY3_9BACT|nr:hypothetical protein FUAX_54430 [Fulvitalea axinellae]